MLERARRRRGETIERVRDVLRDALERGAETGAQAKELLDLLLELADLTQSFRAKRGRALLRLDDDPLRPRRHLALERVVAGAKIVEVVAELALAPSLVVDATVKIGDLGLHRRRACSRAVEVHLQLVALERPARNRELDVTLAVAAEPGAPQVVVVVHGTKGRQADRTLGSGRWI